MIYTKLNEMFFHFYPVCGIPNNSPFAIELFDNIAKKTTRAVANKDTSIEIALAILAEADPALAAKVKAIPEMVALLDEFQCRAEIRTLVPGLTCQVGELLDRLTESEAKHEAAIAAANKTPESGPGEATC